MAISPLANTNVRKRKAITALADVSIKLRSNLSTIDSLRVFGDNFQAEISDLSLLTSRLRDAVQDLLVKIEKSV